MPILFPVWIYESLKSLYEWIIRDPLPRLITAITYVVTPWVLFTQVNLKRASDSIGIYFTVAMVITAGIVVPMAIGKMVAMLVRAIEARYVRHLISDTSEESLCKLLGVDRFVFGLDNLRDLYDTLAVRIREIGEGEQALVSKRVLRGIHRIMVRCRYTPLCLSILEVAPKSGDDSTLLSIPWCIASFAGHPREQEVANAGSKATRALRKRIEAEEIGSSLLRPVEKPAPETQLLRPATSSPVASDDLLRPVINDRGF